MEKNNQRMQIENNTISNVYYIIFLILMIFENIM